MTTTLSLLALAIVLVSALPGTSVIFETAANLIRKASSRSKQKISESVAALQIEKHVPATF